MTDSPTAVTSSKPAAKVIVSKTQNADGNQTVQVTAFNRRNNKDKQLHRATAARAFIHKPSATFFARRSLRFLTAVYTKQGGRIDSHNGWFQLSAWLSEDDGKSWRGGLVLDERKGISYPDGFQAPDGAIYISYDRNRARRGVPRWTCWRKNWSAKDRNSGC